MREPISYEKSLEIIVERLILMVGKLNERTEHLHHRILQLENILLENPSKYSNDKRTYIS